MVPIKDLFDLSIIKWGSSDENLETNFEIVCFISPWKKRGSFKTFKVDNENKYFDVNLVR